MRDDILTGAEIENILRRHMLPGEWMSLSQLYALVERHASLTPADWEPDAPGSSGVRWQRNVRNLLQKRKSRVGAGGVFEWDPDTRMYRLG